MAERPSFQQTQYAFAAHIRDPENVPAPGNIEQRRMAIYRELFFNNLKSLLSTTYPVLKALHSDRKWRQMIRQFMVKHRAQTPYFPELPSEFLAFLEHEYEAGEDDFPFLVELAHYEYVELALSFLDDENDFADIDPDGDLLAGVPVKSVLSWVFAYRYPVHRIAKDFIPDAPSPEPVYLAVTRTSSDKVRFTELNPVTAGLLFKIDENAAGRSGEQLLRELASDIGFDDVDAFIGHGRTAFDELKAKEIIIGVQAPNKGTS